MSHFSLSFLKIAGNKKFETENLLFTDDCDTIHCNFSDRGGGAASDATPMTEFGDLTIFEVPVKLVRIGISRT